MVYASDDAPDCAFNPALQSFLVWETPHEPLARVTMSQPPRAHAESELGTETDFFSLSLAGARCGRGKPAACIPAEGLEEGDAAGGDDRGGSALDRRQPTRQDRLL